MFKKPEDISPLPSGMMDAFDKAVNTQLGNYDVAQEAPAPEAPSAEADIPEQQVEESVELSLDEDAKKLTAVRDHGQGKKQYKSNNEKSAKERTKEVDALDALDEDNTNDKSDDGEGLDKVQPKAVKKKFKDRKDKDIDNDGDTDDSDEYLHKRRKAISKAIAKEEAKELAELKNTHAVIDTAQDGKVVSVATNEKGAKSSIVSAERPPMNIKNKKTLKVVQLKKPTSRNKGSAIIGAYLNDDGTIARYEETGDSGKPEGFFSEEMNPTDHVTFNKETNMFCVYDKDGKKVYESEKEEEANQYAIDNHDALMGRDSLEEISGKLNKKGEIEMTKANFAKVHKDYKTKIKGQPYAMQIDPKSGGSALFPVKFIKESVELDEAKSSSGYDLYHRDFSGAMQHAYAFAKKKGFIVDKDEIDSKVAMGPKRPSSGKTNKYILGTNKKKNVHVQVANLDNKRYELNMYIESVNFDEAKLESVTESKMKEGNSFTKALAAARLNGDDDFIVSGKKYKVTEHNEDLDEALRNPYKGKSSSDLKRKLNSFESQLQDLIKKSKGRSRREIEGEIRDMETKVQQVRSALKEDLDLDEGFSNFAVPIPKQTLNGKKIGGGKTPIVVKARSTREAITKAAKQLGVDFKFLKTGKVVKEAVDPADMDDMKATKGDKESAKMNIIVQLRKAADVKGNLDIVFADGKKQKLPANIIKIALDKYNSFRKPATKKKLVDGMSKSYRSMLQTLKTIKEYSEESGSEES